MSNSRITAAQLTSTKSYADKDLSGVKFDGNNMRRFAFNDQNLTGASFVDTSIARAKFDNAVITNANFTRATSNGFT